MSDLLYAYQPYLNRMFLHNGEIVFWWYRKYHSRTRSAWRAFKLCKRLKERFYVPF